MTIRTAFLSWAVTLTIAAPVARAGDLLLSGRRLVLRARAQTAALRLASSDAALTLGRGNGSADDPVRAGGTLRIVSTAGNRFDRTLPLPGGRWRYLGRPGRARGYRYRARGDHDLSIVVRPGKELRISARGALGLTLGRDPNPVAVVLTLGELRYCTGFRGTVAFRAGRRWVASDADAPPVCGPPAALPDPRLVPWPMHAIDGRYRGSNALFPGDVNGDGLTDYVTNYEFDQRYVIEFHPPAGAPVRRPWPTVDAFTLPPQPAGIDTESAALADLDGDGHLDIVGVQGGHFSTFFEGDSPGIHVIWGPAIADVTNPAAWTDGGRIPGTVDQGHFLWVVPFDVNGDGAIDLLVGGRKLYRGAMPNASIKWIEAPALPADRRDLSAWTVHDVDPTGFDGHGFVHDDVDGDGDQDLLDANADFDTPDDEEVVQWFENPGTGDPAQMAPWPKHEIYRGSEFYYKPQIAVADLDGDGRRDFVTQVHDAVYWFRKTATAPVAFERIVITKPPFAQQDSRPISAGDLDGDGRLDLFAMTTHEGGVIAPDKAAAFWMSWSGPAPTADNWTYHVVKWGSGKPMQIPSFGEKWDQVVLTDVDGDGDLDAVANCEEWWEDDVVEFAPYTDPGLDPHAVAVVWFENRLGEAPFVAGEQAGVCAIEAEHWADLRDGTWIERASYPGFAGDAYVQVHDPQQTTARAWADSRGLAYLVDVAGGDYHVWLRRWTPAKWGTTLGGAASNAVWIGVDEEPRGVADDVDPTTEAWTWVEAPGPVSLTPGRHLLVVKAHEGGYALDRIVLARDDGFVPSGDGPAETLLP